MFEGSDHRPLISFLDTTRKKGKKIFRFDRRLRDNAEIKTLIQQVWESNPYLDVEDRLGLCRREICKWSKAFQENSRKTLVLLRDQLDAAMTSPIPNNHLIHQLNMSLLQTYIKEEEYWKQRSKQLWLTLGDSNTGYFHATTKARKAKNRMTVIEDDMEVPHFEEEQIAKVICQFYNQLFISSDYDGLHTIEEALSPCVSPEINEELIKDSTPSEIREAIFTIHPDKAPGPDGFSASFFQANWEVVGPEVVREIQLFFASGQLRPSQNVTHVRLIPKIIGAKRVSDYRPIALCNVFFKIISKLLALRLKSVLHLIISENQSAFIP